MKIDIFLFNTFKEEIAFIFIGSRNVGYLIKLFFSNQFSWMGRQEWKWTFDIHPGIKHVDHSRMVILFY